MSDIKVNDEGKLVITKGGADSVLNFSSLRLIESGTLSGVTSKEKIVPLTCNVQPRIIITYAEENGVPRLNLYWEQHAFNFEGSTLLLGAKNTLLRAYDVTDASFKIKCNNTVTYTVNYWCFA